MLQVVPKLSLLESGAPGVYVGGCKSLQEEEALELRCMHPTAELSFTGFNVKGRGYVVKEKHASAGEEVSLLVLGI